MPASSIILIGVAAVAVAAAASAFAIAWRRMPNTTDWRSAVSPETREADSRRQLELPEVPAAADQQDTPTEPTEPQPAATPDHPSPSTIKVESRQRFVESPPEEQGVTRRQFFNRALGTTTFTLFGVLGLQSLAFLWPRLQGGFGADIIVGNIRDLLNQTANDDATITPVFIPEARAYIVPAPASLPEVYEGKKVVAGGLFALWQRCVHLGCRVPWCQPSQGFECPCHGSKYSVIGEYFAGPAPRSLDRFVVEETETGELLVKTGQIVQTPRLDRLNIPYPQGPFCVG